MKMKTEFTIIMISILMVLTISFLTYNEPQLTGNVIFNDSEDLTNQEIEIITREQALESISNAEKTINEMKDQGFSLFYVNDTIIEAKRALQKTEYAEILKENLDSTPEQKQEAKNALKLIDWKNLTYNNVLTHTNEIESRKKQAYEIIDEITILKKQLEKDHKKTIKWGIIKFNTKEIDLSNATNLLEQAEFAFEEDRYDDAKNYLDQSKKETEIAKTQSATLSTIKGAVLFIFQKYWPYILVILVILVIIAYYIYKKIKIRRLKKKIKRLKTQKISLKQLMKKTQIKRFRFNSISGLVYNIRMKKYKGDYSKIKQTLPVLEKNLQELINKKFTKTKLNEKTK
jgi:hypothetical protein